MADWATAGGHWYRPDGSPFYTTVGANGERPATLRDARKIGAYPSVTGVIRCAAAPGLEKWKRNQLLLAALTLPKIDGESEESWLRRVEQDWQKEGREAAERGTAIHAAIEKYYRSEWVDPDLMPWVHAAARAITDYCGSPRWHQERSFASPFGYGGKTDLHSGEWVIDVKGKETLDDAKLWDEHCMQLGAYREGLNLPGARCGILFVSRTKPEAVLIEAKDDEIVRGWQMFQALLIYWRIKNNYAP